jgi:hypothetical protein
MDPRIEAQTAKVIEAQQELRDAYCAALRRKPSRLVMAVGDFGLRLAGLSDAVLWSAHRVEAVRWHLWATGFLSGFSVAVALGCLLWAWSGYRSL